MFAPIRAFASTHAFQQSPFASFPVLLCASWMLWFGHMHMATKMASSIWSARKEYSPQGSSQAPRQTQNKSCKKSNISSKRTIDSATAKSSTTGLSARPIAVATTRFLPLSESHPRHCRNTFPDDETTTMIFTITMSIRHPLAQPFLVVHAMHGSILWKIARCLWISARCLWKSARCLQHLLWENSFRCVFSGAL